MAKITQDKFYLDAVTGLVLIRFVLCARMITDYLIGKAVVG